MPDAGNGRAGEAPRSHGLSRRGFVAAGAAVGAAVVELISAPSGAAARAGVRADPTPARHKRRKPAAKKVPAGLPPPAPIYAKHSDPGDLGVLEAASLLQAGLISSAEITTACQTRIVKRNG